jgi:hypothetical protein
MSEEIDTVVYRSIPFHPLLSLAEHFRSCLERYQEVDQLPAGPRQELLPRRYMDLMLATQAVSKALIGQGLGETTFRIGNVTMAEGQALHAFRDLCKLTSRLWEWGASHDTGLPATKIPLSLSVGIDQAVNILRGCRAGLAEPSPEVRPVQECSQNTKGKRIDERMMTMLRDRAESIGWTARQWAEALKCSHSTVVESKTWNETIRLVQGQVAAQDQRGHNGAPIDGRRRRRPRKEE